MGQASETGIAAPEAPEAPKTEEKPSADSAKSTESGSAFTPKTSERQRAAEVVRNVPTFEWVQSITVSIMTAMASKGDAAGMPPLPPSPKQGDRPRSCGRWRLGDCP